MDILVGGGLLASSFRCCSLRVVLNDAMRVRGIVRWVWTLVGVTRYPHLLGSLVIVSSSWVHRACDGLWSLHVCDGKRFAISA